MKKKRVNILILSGMMVSSLLCMKETSVTTLVDHKGYASVAITNNGEWMATGGSDQKLKLWQTKEGKSWVLMQEVSVIKECICSLMFDPSNTLLAVGYEYGTVVLLEKKLTDDWIFKQELLFGSNHFTFREQQIEKLIHAKFIGEFSDLADKLKDPIEEANMNKILNYEEIEKAENHVYALSFDPNGDWLAIGFGSGALNLWGKNGYGTWDFKKQYDVKADGVCSVNFDKTGNFLVTAGTGMHNEISLYEKKSDASWEKIKKLVVGHVGTIMSAFLDASGSELISAGADQTLRLSIKNEETQKWDTSCVFAKMKESIFSMAINTKEALLACGSFGDGKILLYEKKGKHKWVFARKIGYHRVSKEHNLKNGANCLVFDPSNDYLVSGGIDGTVKIWDIHQNKKTYSTDQNLLVEEKAN